MKIELRSSVESFLTGKVLQKFLLTVKTLGKERMQHMFSVIYLISSFNISSYCSFSLCILLFHQGHFGNSALRGLLAVSLTLNAIFTSAYVYRSLRWFVPTLPFLLVPPASKKTPWQNEFNHGFISNGRATGACCWFSLFCVFITTV